MGSHEPKPFKNGDFLHLLPLYPKAPTVANKNISLTKNAEHYLFAMLLPCE